MLVAIQVHDKASVLASDVSRAHGPFVCPHCGEPASLRRGSVRLPHFAHRRPDACDYGAAETDEHRQCKTEIYDALRKHPAATAVALEFRLGKVRPDVFARLNGVPVAIEVQLSTLSPETITRRTMEYTRLGIHVLWLRPWTPKLNTGRYSPRRFERWVHAAYFGRAYFWQRGLTLLPVRFTPLDHYVGKFDWRDRHGERQTGGGYSRPSKRFHRVAIGNPLHLLRDFRGVRRPPWQSKTLTVPEALLYLDTNGPVVDERSNPSGSHEPGHHYDR